MHTTTIGTDALICPDIRNTVGESPVWDHQTQRWLWIDQVGKVFRLDPATGQVSQWALPEKTGSMVLRPNGHLVASCETGIFDVDLHEADPSGGVHGTPTLTRLADITHPKSGMRFNDGRCDRQGRLWVSTFVMDTALGQAAGEWFRFTPGDGLTPSGMDGFVIPNGSAFSPDGKRFYCADSHRDVRMLWTFDLDTDEGVLSNKRPFADLRQEVGRPDGAAVDTDGCYWVCGIEGGCIMRFTPAGVMDRKILIPMVKPTMCSFGGSDGRTMLVTSLCRGEAELATDPHAGRVLMFRPGSQGIEEPRLADAN